MELRITKNTGKPHILAYTRNNGSVTWMYADDYFVHHDLSHYAIESTMPYLTAFTGMLNDGMDIKDFEDREKRALITLTAEGAYAENMANLFLTELSDGPFEDFNQVQQEAFVSSFGNRYPIAQIPAEKVAQVRERLQQLLAQWQAMPVGATLSLTFPL